MTSDKFRDKKILNTVMRTPASKGRNKKIAISIIMLSNANRIHTN